MPVYKQRPVVLCIEDEANIADVLRASLASGGFKVLVAATAGEGLEKARSAAPDLILLDLILPDINGYSFFDLLEEAGLSHIPVMIVSGCASSEAQALGLDLGACDYVTKPFSLSDLIARANRAIAGARLKKKAAPLEARSRRSKTNSQPDGSVVKAR